MITILLCRFTHIKQYFSFFFKEFEKETSKKMEFQHLTVDIKEINQNKKRREETVELFNELIQIDGEEWRMMMADLAKKEFEDQWRRMQKRLIEREREEQEEWDRHLIEVGKRLQMIKLFEELPNE